jgi:uncharacterized protein with HEPN domain
VRPEDLDRLEHILEAAERIAVYAAPGEEAFLADPMRQDAIIRNLEIIGEAASRVSRELRDDHPEIPWAEVIGHRNVLVHDYRRLIHGLIWRVVAEELPTLADRVRAIVASSHDDVAQQQRAQDARAEG